MEPVGYWLKDVPYIWVSNGQMHLRYYLTNRSDWVYVAYDDLRGGTVYLRYLQSDVEDDVLEGRESRIRNVYRISPSKGCESLKALDLFRVYNPYFMKIPVDRVKRIDLRMNGKRIDPLSVFSFDTEHAGHLIHNQPPTKTLTVTGRSGETVTLR